MAWLRLAMAGCAVLVASAACGGSAFTAADGGGGGGAGGGTSGAGGGGGGGGRGEGDGGPGGGGGVEGGVIFDAAAGCSSLGHDTCVACCDYTISGGRDALYTDVWPCVCPTSSCQASCNPSACTAQPGQDGACTACLVRAATTVLTCEQVCIGGCKTYADCYASCPN